MFSGCGGFDLGFHGGFKFLGKNYKKLGFETIWANDIDEFSCDTFQSQFQEAIVECGDAKSKIEKIPKKADIVLAGFPCQDFSLSGKRRGLRSKRGNLYKEVCRVLKKVKPLVLVAENVEGILSIEEGLVCKKIMSDFKRSGYHVRVKLLNAKDYLVPQNRSRAIFICTRKTDLPAFDFNYIKPKKSKLSSYMAIKDLEFLEENAVPNHIWSKAKRNKGQGNSPIKKQEVSPCIRAEHHGNIEFHWNNKRRLSARECARIQSFPDDFVFPCSTSQAYKQIGNAVPPVFAWSIAKGIEKFLKENIRRN